VNTYPAVVHYITKPESRMSYRHPRALPTLSLLITHQSLYIKKENYYPKLSILIIYI